MQDATANNNGATSGFAFLLLPTLPPEQCESTKLKSLSDTKRCHIVKEKTSPGGIYRVLFALDRYRQDLVAMKTILEHTANYITAFFLLLLDYALHTDQFLVKPQEIHEIDNKCDMKQDTYLHLR